MSGHLGLLVTGSAKDRMRFHALICLYLNAIDQRGETVRYSCMEEDLPGVLQAAELNDVTVQKIVTIRTENEQHLDLGGGASATVSDCIEEYPVLHLASHGRKWERVDRNEDAPRRM